MSFAKIVFVQIKIEDIQSKFPITLLKCEFETVKFVDPKIDEKMCSSIENANSDVYRSAVRFEMVDVAVAYTGV